MVVVEELAQLMEEEGLAQWMEEEEELVCQMEMVYIELAQWLEQEVEGAERGQLKVEEVESMLAVVLEH